MKRFLLIVALALGITCVQAQVSTEVSNIMAKCRQAMNPPTGIEYAMDAKTSMGPVSLMTINFVIAQKGTMNRTKMTMKIMGEEVVSELGFDGSQHWEVSGDTITLSSQSDKDSDSDISLDLDKKYKKAKMKEKDGFYIITFSEPYDKANEAKSITTKISTKNYVLRETKSSAKGAKVTMTFSKYRVGLKDDYFKLALSKYPNAVVIRK